MPRILLLEDSNELASSTIGLLQARGHDVLRFSTIKQAATAIPPVGFQVMIIDHDLPDGNGLQYVEQCRRAWPMPDDDSDPADNPAWPTTILWSGLDRTDEIAEDAYGDWIDYFILKGAHAWDELLAALEVK